MLETLSKPFSVFHSEILGVNFLCLKESVCCNQRFIKVPEMFTQCGKVTQEPVLFGGASRGSAVYTQTSSRCTKLGVATESNPD